MEALLTARGLHKTYRKRARRVTVLEDCDLDLAPGQAVAVIGSSGSGKTTLLNLLGALDRPDAGRLLHRGEPVDLRRASVATRWRQQVVGFIFQFHFLLPDFTAWENLLIPVRAAGTVGDEHRRRARDLLAALEMSDRADHLPGELSGGEQQRVAVARAFMNRPQIVLADEPFGNLDREKGARLGELLFDLGRREGAGLVVVTHDRELAARADRVLELRAGRLAAADRLE
ncbi:MAG: ABC transporter ATP-binding protein [Candidatus Krumholzibacteriia bacterium]